MTDRTGDVHCPRCGAAAERGQLVCLECGARVALVYRRPPSWKVPVAITAVVALLLGVAAFMAVAALSDDADREVAAAPPRPKPAATKTTGAKEKAEQPKKAGEPAAESGALVKRGSLYQWPRTLEGFTVVINSTEDRASATSFARSASRSKPAKLGVIRADDFKTLPQGFYVVFAGFYEDRGKADQATERLNAKYPGSFTQAVER
ncbi:MAG TPA: hypothetical protein VFY44_12105 [Thermoleophilaceae bacterium]|nr:hypothetical protein [Thermoleophilaceae bacterium]